MNSTAALLDQVASDLDRALQADAVAGLSDAEKVDLLRAAGEVQRRVDALTTETVATVDGRPAGSGVPTFAAQFGCRNMNELLQRLLRVDAPGAARIVRAAKAVHRELDITSGALLPARWPALREALLDGTIGIPGLLAATGPIDQAGDRVGAADRLRADAELTAYARGCSSADVASDVDTNSHTSEVAPPATPEDLKVLAQVIVMYLDPDGAEPADERAMRARGLTLGRAKDGIVPVRGGLLPEVAGQLQRIWDAYLNPKVDGPPNPGVVFRPSDELATDADTTYSSADEDDDSNAPTDARSELIDTRTRAQKQHDAFAAALGIAARHDDMPTLGGAAPTLVVSVTAADYATGRGWAHIDGIDIPVPVDVARHTACAGGVQRVLFDPEGRIVGIGITDRLFNSHQRRAIILRDKHCLIPSCHVPASWCEVHHVREHARGRPTHTDNGVALCWHHHRTLDTSGWEIRMQNGTPQIRGPAWWDPHQKWREPRPLLSASLRR